MATNKNSSKKSSSRSGSKKSASGSKRNRSSKSGSKQGSKPQAVQNPSQEAAGHVGDEGHARVRPSQTRSVVGGNGRSSSRRTRKQEEFKDYSVVDPKDIEGGPDVLIAVPVVKVDEIDIEVDDLHAQVAVLAEVRKLVKIGVGAEAQLDKVELKIEGVEAQALLKAKLNNVTAILERVLLSLDRNPALLQSVGKAVEEVGAGTGDLLDESGDAVEDVGEGTKKALGPVGEGAGQAVSQVGKGAGEGVGEIGEGAERGVAGVGRGAKRGVAGVGRGTGRGVEGVGQGAKQLTDNLAQGGQPGQGRAKKQKGGS
jgi:hypothetical protein